MVKPNTINAAINPNKFISPVIWQVRPTAHNIPMTEGINTFIAFFNPQNNERTTNKANITQGNAFKSIFLYDFK